MENQNKRERWEGILREWHESGLSQRRYCLRQSLPYTAFRYWYRKLGSEKEQTKVSSLISAVEVARIEMESRTITRNIVLPVEIESERIVIAIPGTKATVTIAGRMSLTCLNRILNAFEGLGGHAKA
jgi:hypothetical protein